MSRQRVLSALGALGVRQGFVFIVVVVINWTVSDRIGEHLSAKSVDPFLTTVICNSLYTVFLIIHGFKKLLGKGSHWIPVLEFGDAAHPTLAMTEKQLIKAAGYVSCFWFVGQWLYSASLRTTSEKSHGILANTAIAWTFLLSSSLRLDNFTSTKALFVLITFLGVACDTFARNMSAAPESEADRWWGGFLAIGSALFYAIYTCLLKSLLPNDEKVDMLGFLGYVGLWNSVTFGPVAAILAGTGKIDTDGLETRTVAFIVTMGFIDNIFSDYLWARGVLLTTPTVVTCGVALQTPLGMFVDLCAGRGGFLRKQVPGTLAVGGAVLAVMGFCGVVFETPSDWEAQAERIAATPRHSISFGVAEAPAEEGDLETAHHGGPGLGLGIGKGGGVGVGGGGGGHAHSRVLGGAGYSRVGGAGGAEAATLPGAGRAAAGGGGGKGSAGGAASSGREAETLLPEREGGGEGGEVGLPEPPAKPAGVTPRWAPAGAAPAATATSGWGDFRDDAAEGKDPVSSLRGHEDDADDELVAQAAAGGAGAGDAAGSAVIGLAERPRSPDREPLIAAGAAAAATAAAADSGGSGGGAQQGAGGGKKGGAGGKKKKKGGRA